MASSSPPRSPRKVGLPSTALAAALTGALAAAVLALLPARAAAQDREARTVAPSGVRATWSPLGQGDEPAHDALNDALRSAERDHLRRVGAWGLANAAGGLALALASDRDTDPVRHGFAVQSAGWGLVNTGIAAAGLTFGGRGDGPGTPGEALAAESRWGQILVLNLGLNAGYMMAGGALAWAGGRGIDRGDELRGHGMAVIVQGLGLLVLDGVAWLGHRDRVRAFAELMDAALEGAELSAGPSEDGGLSVRIRMSR